jgi:hypothetical protein
MLLLDTGICEITDEQILDFFRVPIEPVTTVSPTSGI